MRKALAVISLCLCAAASSQAADHIEDYGGPFTTQALYTMCSSNNQKAREKCNLYLQGLLYGITTQRAMQEHGSAVCLPDIATDEARREILQFIDVTTHGKPSSNGDRGDWIAFVALAAGHLCKKDSAK